MDKSKKNTRSAENSPSGGSDIRITDEHGQSFEVPVKGSLGLLALGATGLIAWRQKRREQGPENPAS